jgi:hypothetical protein
VGVQGGLAILEDNFAVFSKTNHVFFFLCVPAVFTLLGIYLNGLKLIFIQNLLMSFAADLGHS